MNEIFGEENFVANIIWEKKYAPQNDARYFSDNHDYILAYAKRIDSFKRNLLPRTEESKERYKNPDNDPRGPWKASDFSRKAVLQHTIYEIELPSGRKVLPPNGRSWVKDPKGLREMVKDNRIWFGPNGDSVPAVKRFLSEVQEGLVPLTIWPYSEVGHNQEAVQELKELFDGKVYFDAPKPIRLLNRVTQLVTNSEDIVLDFFAGSATSAHAVLALNNEDGGIRKFICVQLPEKTSEDSEAFKAGYKTIAEIGKER
ncbi:MAG: site-specific DNA-methyltransferase, partial [Elusimicrobia bacterium]|nr:site-specific DNA-methyltransferase [Elusimicrobiota bacterium]